ncbi:MAG TPA: hypothetical protein VGS07_11420 [Thermoanaerobaculia bacterium]|jgi:hypothetical protein|nr:hypothetical protein [Thermoanaerobaculia bacterium]
MATVINEVTIEPKTMPPGDPAAGGAGDGGYGGQIPPDLQCELEKLARLSRERAARLLAY